MFKCLRPHPGLLAADALSNRFERRPFPRAYPRLYAIAATRCCRRDTVLARTPSPHQRLRVDATRPQPRRLRPASLRPANVDTNVPETTEKRDKSPRLAPS